MPFLQPNLTRLASGLNTLGSQAGFTGAYGVGQDIYALAGATGTSGSGATGPIGPTGAIGSTGAMGATGAAGGGSSPQPPSIDLGASPATATTLGGGSITNISGLTSIPVVAGERYRVSLYAVHSSSISYTATQYIQSLVTFNTTADAIVMTNVQANTSGLGSSTTIEFRVPATNTQANIQLRGVGLGGLETATIAVFSFYIIPLGV